MIQEQNLFLRSNTAEGCMTFAADLYAPRTAGFRAVLLKSVAGGTATAFMKTLVEKAAAAELTSTVFWEAPGKEKLAAVIFPQPKLVVLDADAPYALEPKLSGAIETVLSFDVCRDAKKLAAVTGTLEELSADATRERERITRFLRASRAMKRDVRFVSEESVDRTKIERYASRFAAKNFPKPVGRVGKESKRFLSSLSGQGLLLRRSGITQTCGKVIIFEDDFGVTAPILLDLIRGYALGNGLDVVSCPCLLDPKNGPEHLIVPAADVACITANKRHPIDVENAEHILAARFMEKDLLRTHRSRLNFCRRTMREMLAEAYAGKDALDKSNAAIDRIYRDCTNFKTVKSLAESVYTRLF
jgi:hypothetical protein